MSQVTAWIYTTPAAWAALDGNPAVDQYTYANELQNRPFKAPQAGYEVHGIVGTESQVEAFISALGVDVLSQQEWDYSTGLDQIQSDGAFGTTPAEVLAVMPDHVIYDENGDVVSTEAPTYDTPNWASVFAGQGAQIFAGNFSDGFSDGFK